MNVARNFFMSVARCMAMALLLLTALIALPVQAALVPVPALTARVTDSTQTLDQATRSQLTQQLAALEQRKGAQIAVLMIPTTGDESIEQYALRAFEQWKLGRKNVDDGILFVIAKNDRKLRIEVGYGLGGAVTDLSAGRIIREQVAPRFKQGDFAGGVTAGVESLVKLVDGEDLPPVESQPESDSESLFMLVPLAAMAFIMPPLFAFLAVGFFVGIMFGSVVAGVLAAMAALLLSFFGRALGAGGKGGLARASRRGGAAGGLGGLGGGFGGGGFGGGGGGFGGGGGGSGGGGASGGW